MNRLEQIAAELENTKKPPVHLWKPDHLGSIDIRIDINGHWYHEGDRIARDALVVLFSSILWFEQDAYFLVTPVEKLQIEVEDVPFVINQMEWVDNSWVAVTNTHEQIIISQEHPVQLRQFKDQWIPYVKVRYDLWARVNRSIYFQWVEAALERDPNKLMLVSGDYEFEVGRLTE